MVGWWTLCRRPKRVYVVKGGLLGPGVDRKIHPETPVRGCGLVQYPAIGVSIIQQSSSTSYVQLSLEVNFFFFFPLSALIRASVCRYKRQQSLINDRMKKKLPPPLRAAGGTDLSGPLRFSAASFAPVMCCVVIIVSWELLFVAYTGIYGWWVRGWV